MAISSRIMPTPEKFSDFLVALTTDSFESWNEQLRTYDEWKQRDTCFSIYHMCATERFMSRAKKFADEVFSNGVNAYYAYLYATRDLEDKAETFTKHRAKVDAIAAYDEARVTFNEYRAEYMRLGAEVFAHIHEVKHHDTKSLSHEYLSHDTLSPREILHTGYRAVFNTHYPEPGDQELACEELGTFEEGIEWYDAYYQ
jgi:hypothetical protein